MRRNLPSPGLRGQHPRSGLLARLGATLGVAGLVEAVVLILLALTPAGAHAQSPYDRNSSYSATAGVNLPSAVQTYGQDEVQAAGGVACRSSVSGGGPYVDAGVVGANDLYGRQSTSAYARVVVPLGRAPKRVDCTQLYDLEIKRLRMELEMAKMGMPPGVDGNH